MPHPLLNMTLRWVASVVVVAIAVLLGCAGSRDRTAPVEPVIAHRPPQLAKPIADSLASVLAKPNGPVAPPQNVLTLSGGGQYAAYNAGLLAGWTAAGNRPKFDVVTGISSGAIVAIHAFLGPQYDDNLRRFFTTTRKNDLFVLRPVVELLRNGSLASSKRLEELIEAEVNDCFLFDLREAHKEGRRLYIGTMNAGTRRLVIWDLGAVACSGRPDADQLVRKVLLASIAYPGLLPPVEFDVVVDGERYTEQHVDGGAVSQAFLRLGPGAEAPAEGATGWLCGSNLYAMAAGKLYPPPVSGRIGFLSRVGGSISAALYALYRAELVGMYAFCGVSGMRYHMIAIPEDTDVPENSMSFEAEAMRRLYAMGYDAARCGIRWRLTPPGTEPGEEEQPQADERLAQPQRK